MINEKLGVPEHIIDSAKKIWDETVKKVDMYYNQLKENYSVDFYVTNLKISDFKIKSVKVKFNVKYTDRTYKPVLAGMSIPARVKPPTEIDSVHYDIPSDIEIYVNLYINPDNSKQDLMNFLTDERVQLISSFAHELKHSYDFKKKTKHSIKSEMDYIHIDDNYTGIDIFDKFMYFLYFSHMSENLVKATEVGTSIKVDKVSKVDFRNYLKSNRVYKELKEMSDYNMGVLYNGLISEMDKIEDIFKHNNIEIGNNDENVKQFLTLMINHILNGKVNSLNIHLKRMNPMFMIFGSQKIDELFDEIEKIANKYKNNPINFFENQIKYINFIGNKYKKKLTKLYDLIEEEPNQLHNIINNRIKNFQNFNNGK